MLRNFRLRSAINRGDLEALESALRAGADPESRNPQGLSALMMAASRGHVELVHALVTAGADPNRAVRVSHPLTSGVTALMAACTDSSGAVEPVLALLELGADPALADSEGRTALDYASISGYSEIVSCLESL